jgi:hypothetical protein
MDHKYPHVDAELDQAIHFDADPDPHQSDTNLQQWPTDRAPPPPPGSRSGNIPTVKGINNHKNFSLNTEVFW